MGHLTLQSVRLVVGGRTLLEDVSFAALPGELVALVGPNGAGKTSLLRAVAGFAHPAAGKIALDDMDVATLPSQERARAVTLIGSDVESPPGTTVREVVATGRFAYRPWWDWIDRPEDAAAAAAALERVGLAALGERSFETLSSGERQRAWLALALAQNARLVLLDEPTSHLDPRFALEMLRLVRDVARETTTVVVVLHDLNEAAAVCDRVAVLGHGRLLAYGPPDAALDPEVLERAFGIAFDRIDFDGTRGVMPRAYRRRAPLTGT